MRFHQLVAVKECPVSKIPEGIQRIVACSAKNSTKQARAEEIWLLQ